MGMNNVVLQELLERYDRLKPLEFVIRRAGESMIDCYRKGGKVLVCGNGGSSADADHIVGELMKSFEKKRPLERKVGENLHERFGDQGKWLADNLQQGLPALSLSAHTSLVTAISNDLGGDLVFAQQVTGYGDAGDVLLALSTSGNARNVINALMVAKAKGMITIGMTGETGGKMKEFCDILINVPEKRTACVQELHLPIYHTLCRMVEFAFFGNNRFK